MRATDGVFFRCVDIPERSLDSNVTSLEESSHTPALPRPGPVVVVVIVVVIIVIRRGSRGREQREGRYLHLLSSGAQAHEFGKPRRHFCCFGSLCSSFGVYQTLWGRSGRKKKITPRVDQSTEEVWRCLHVLFFGRSHDRSQTASDGRCL